MCNVMVVSTIVEVLDEMIKNKEVFTAFDITKAARKTTSDPVLHKDVKSIVGNEFQSGQMRDYDRELCTLNIDNTPDALVYFPNGKMPENHPLVDGASTSSNSSTNSVVGDNIVKITAEGRINIPKKILDQVSSIGGSYDLEFNGTIYPKIPNVDGRVRLSKQDLDISGNNVKITVNATNNTIVLESV